MAEQLSFDLPVRSTGGRDAFFVSSANALAVAALDAVQTWQGRRMILQGPPSSGKSHLLGIWLNDHNATQLDLSDDLILPDPGSYVAVEDIDQIAGKSDQETNLFHLINHSHASDGTLLLSTSKPVSHCGFQLPDLLSRLQAVQVTKIDTPDDALLGAVLLKAFMDRQLSPSPAVQSYILKHMNRSFADALHIVATLDQISMSEKRPITRAMAAAVLQNNEDP